MADTQIDAQFMQLLGRPATPDEREYFGKFINQGELQVHEIGQILQSTPEFQKAQLGKDTAAYGQQLNAQNADILNMAGAQANSRFASLGRPNTSAMGASVMQAGGQLAQQRQSALADFYGRGLQSNAALGAQQGMAATDRGYQERDTVRQRNWDVEDYYRQQNDYNTAKKSASGWNAITPEFVASGLFSMGGQMAGAEMGRAKSGATKAATGGAG